MKNMWDLKIDGQMYHVEMKNKNLFINGEKQKLDRKTRSKSGFISEEHTVTIGSKTALIVMQSAQKPLLIIDNKDCATGEEYVPVTTPKWAYIFFVLHCLNFTNGAIGAMMAVFGISITTSISSNKNMNIVVRILLDIIVLVLAYVVVFCVAFALAGILY